MTITTYRVPPAVFTPAIIELLRVEAPHLSWGSALDSDGATARDPKGWRRLYIGHDDMGYWLRVPGLGEGKRTLWRLDGAPEDLLGLVRLVLASHEWQGAGGGPW